jgi:parvulin-like peptidyl-prolyl isomerase
MWCAVFLLVLLVVAGCGGGGSSGTTGGTDPASVGSTGVEANPNAVVARVGGAVITKASFEHALFIAARSEESNPVIPVPPNFTACVTRLKAPSEGSASAGASAASAATLRSRCSVRYDALETTALDKLILDDWLAGGAAEEGVSVSAQEVDQRLQSLDPNRSDQSRLEKNLALQGRTMADHLLELRIQMLAEGIRRAIARRTGHISQAQVVSDYDQHKQAFGVPERRDFHIFGAASRAEAERAKREVVSGKSFAVVVKKLPSEAQPIFSVKGLVLGYKSGEYHQVPLNRAIFAARPYVLTGPVGVSGGYFVFEVTRVHQGQQKSLAQSEAAIKKTLPAERFNAALAAFIGAWRTRWIARTNCQAGYVVAKCRQFTPTAGSPSESPYLPALE